MTSLGCCLRAQERALGSYILSLKQMLLQKLLLPGSLLTQRMGFVCPELVSVVQGSKLCKLQRRWLQ